jgi:hypothetical protein
MPEMRLNIPIQPHAILTYHARIRQLTLPAIVNEILVKWVAEHEKGPSDEQPQK